MDNNVNEVFNIRDEYISQETMKIAREELRELPEIKEAAITDLRRLLKSCLDINYNDDDQFLLIFLRACHFYPKSALEKMKSIARFRKENEHLLHGLRIESLKEKFVRNNVVNVLKNCDQKGRRIMIVNCGEPWNPSEMPADDVFRVLYIIHIAAQLEPETQVRGVVCIMDFEGLSMKQAKALSPAFSKRLLTFIQDAMPLRMKEIHFVKQPFIFKIVWALFKPYVGEKLNKRMFFHGDNMSSLHQYIAPEILPANYKGVQPKIDYGGKEWLAALDKHTKFISEWSNMGPSQW